MSFPERKPDASQWKVCDLTADLATEYDAALAQGLPFLKIFADVVSIPEDFARTIGGYQKTPGSYIQHIQIIARRMEVGGGLARLRINPPREDGGLTGVSLLVGEIAGKLQIDKVNYDGAGASSVGHSVDAPVTGETEDLYYTRYDSRGRDGQLVKTLRPIELMLLQPGEDLHKLFTASYAHAAGLAGAPAPPADPEKGKLARQIFDWLARWTKYPGHGVAGQSEIAFFAEALTRVLPVLDRGTTVYFIPPRPSADLIGGLKTQFGQAAQMEARIAEAKGRKDLKDTFGQFVATLSGRDMEDLRELDILIVAAGERVKSADKAVTEAAQTIRDLQLDAKIAEIKLKTEKEVQAIWNSVKAVAQIVYGLYQLVTGVGSGLLTAHAAGAVKAVGQIPTTMQFLLRVTAASSDGLKDKAFQVIYTLGYLPYHDMYRAWQSIDKDARDAIIGGIKNGVPSLMSGGGKLNSLYLKDRPDEKDLNAIAALVSDATRAFDAAKSKAAWDTFQIDLEKKLDPEIAAEDQAEVSKAAKELKATLKKMVVAGKLLAEQQSLLAMANRELGTLILRRSTLKGSRALFDKLAENLRTDEQMSDLLLRTGEARVLELKQLFFAKTWEYKAAYFHEWARWPREIARIPADATELGLIYSKLDSDSNADAANSLVINAVKIVIDDEDVLEKFRNTGESSFVIDFQNRDLSHYQIIRLRALIPSIGGVKSKATSGAQGYRISLTSGGFYLDPFNGEELRWQGRPCSVSYTYNADGTVKDYPASPFGGERPSPFTEWTVKVENAGELDLTEVRELRLELQANALPKKS